MNNFININAGEIYKPFAEQKIFHKAKAKFKYGMGGMGSGKTKMLIWDVIDDCMAYPKGRWLIGRDTVQDLEDSTKHDFFVECPEELIKSYKKKLNIVTMQNDSEIIFRSLRGYQGTSHTGGQKRLKALNLSGFALDEASEVKKEDYMYLKGRLRLPNVPEGKRRGIMVSNPPDKSHWLYSEFNGQTDPSSMDRFMIQIPTYSNTYLPADFIANLEKDYDPSWVARYLKGSWGFVLTGDPIYTGFRETLNGQPWHMGDTQFIRGRPVYRDWDFGWHHPAVVFSQDDLESRWRIHREYMGDKVYIWDYAPKVLEISNKFFPGAEFIDYCDPAGKQKSDKNKRTTVQILEEDFKIRPICRFSWVNDGILIIQNKLSRVTAGEPDLMINNAACPILHQGFMGGYARAAAQNGTQMSNWEPVKDGYYEHVMDAIRMGAINRYGSGQASSMGRNLRIGQPSWSLGVSADGQR